MCALICSIHQRLMTAEAKYMHDSGPGSLYSTAWREVLDQRELLLRLLYDFTEVVDPGNIGEQRTIRIRGTEGYRGTLLEWLRN